MLTSRSSSFSNLPFLVSEDGQLVLPFHLAADRLRAAHARAGLEVPEPTEGIPRARDPVMHPAAIVLVAMEDLSISVPYGEVPGVAIRSTELFIQAFGQVGLRLFTYSCHFNNMASSIKIQEQVLVYLTLALNHL